jgi:hypothetical protein
MNIGLSDVVHKSFPDVVPAVRPVFKDISIKEPH